MDILKTPAGGRPQVSGGPIIVSADGSELNSFCAELNHLVEDDAPLLHRVHG